MASNLPIVQPTTYVTATAVGFADSAGNFSLAGGGSPLPVVPCRINVPTALQGQTTSSAIVGPFAPALDLPIHLQLSGTWTGAVSLTRSVNGGVSRQPVTMGGQAWARFTGNANEVVWQEGESGATLYLDITVTSGVVNYRVSQ